MSTRTTRTAAALVAAVALVLGLNGLSSHTQAATSMRNAPTTELEAEADGTTYRARPFGDVIRADTPEYYTLTLPRSGTYHVTMTGFLNYDRSPASVQCFVVDLQKILDEDFSGYYLLSSSDSESSFDFGLNEAIDVALKKSRRILLTCQSNVDIDVLKPITIGFERTGRFKNLNTKPYDPPVRSSEGLFGYLG
jgi:hypothetical protein